jgi:hydrogenase maturation protein HypF
MADETASTERRARRRLLVTGVVQGVGFRPFVYSIAREEALAGFVGNDSRGVFIEIEGAAERLDRFLSRLRSSPPPLAAIDAIQSEDIEPVGEESFAIVESVAQAGRATPVSPDIATCRECLRELLDPSDRRFRYPFINCTHCGPRFTIVQDIPYDRPKTTMKVFPMCPSCDAEYHDPASRRFHAQPNACAACGPRLWFTTGGALTPESPSSTDEALGKTREAFAAGGIVAIKGIGGFHLACDARSDTALRNLRDRKGRVEKPFAMMARDLDVVRRFAEISEPEARLLESKERPIVLLRRRDPPESPLSKLVAPGNRNLGVMLPYAPLHYLLLEDFPLVMTSANRSDEPIVKDNEEAFARLADLADAFLLHDRDIEVVCDDSVIRTFESRELPLRRSRGYAPFPIRNPVEGPAVLAAGGELKATFCITRDGTAYLSQHIGDMENLETLHAFERAYHHMRRIYSAEPRRIACDLHPGYLSTDWARRLAEATGLPLVPVQHHHAHVASLMAESGLGVGERVIGLAFDGTGYGTDGAIWGGEVLNAGYRGFERLGHLDYAPLPGGDASVRKPYRMALSHLFRAGLPWDERLSCVRAASAEERRLLRQQLEKGIHCPSTSSVGRLFDAVAALAGLRQTANYEAQAAMELECAAGPLSGSAPYELVVDEREPFRIDPSFALENIVEDVLRGTSAGTIATGFHLGFAEMMVRAACRARERCGLSVVAMSGGVFQNVLLLSLATERLRDAGFRVLAHRLVPPNDGGIALGQAVVAAALDST